MISRGKHVIDDQGDVKSDAFSDARLLKLIEVWPTLSDDVKGEIARLAGLLPDDLNDVDDLSSEMSLGDRMLS